MFWQVKVPFKTVVTAIDHLLTVNFVSMFRGIRDSMEVPEVHGPN